MLKEASTYGDVIVALNSDEWLARKKGRAFMPFEERRAVIEELKCVSEVIKFDDADGTASHAIQQALVMHPTSKLFFANGGDRTKDNIPELKTCRDLGVEVLFEIGGSDKKQSSSVLLTNWKNNRTERRWGYFNSLHNGGKVRVKQLVLEPLQRISLQYHYHRAEHWFIESGLALVQIGDKQYELSSGDSIKVDKMQLHTVMNISTKQEPLRLIEVQVGDVLDEQDIVRVEETRP